MRQIVEQRLAEMTNEIQQLHNEREAMFRRDQEIEVRLHQLVGAVYEMQQLIAHLDHQPSAEVQVLEPEAVAEAEREHQESVQRSHQTSSGTDDQSTEK